jgi:hypothetical protein
MVRSIALSDHFSSSTQLVEFSKELKGRRPVAIPDGVLSKARDAFEDPQYVSTLMKEAELNPSEASSGISAQRSARMSEPHNGRSFDQSQLHQNPFWVLGASIRDDRRRIVDIAEEKSLNSSDDAYQKARAELTNPRTRLAAEMAWLPGVSPSRANQLMELLTRNPMAVRAESGLPRLAHANLMAAAAQAVDAEDRLNEIAEFIQEIGYLVADVSLENVTRDINEDRAVSDFPQVRSEGAVEEEFAERKRHYRSVLRDALNRLSSMSLVQVMTMAVDGATNSGTKHAPELLDELVDSYVVETQSFLDQEADNARKLIRAINDSGKAGASLIGSLIDKLESVARNWVAIARPIQVSLKTRGIDHQPSRQLAYEIRSMAVDLFNHHGLASESKRLIDMLREKFGELPDVSEQLGADVDALEDIFAKRRQAEERNQDWAREITYKAEVGLLFKDSLSISPSGVEWKGKRYPLESITRIRWGGTRRSINGIPTGTTYFVAWGDRASEAAIELQKSAIYSAFIERLWRAVGVRLLTELLSALKSGSVWSVGEIAVADDGVTLVKHKLLSSNEAVRCGWGEVNVWSANGAFYIGSQNDKKTYGSLSYINVPNVHVLEQGIRMAFKKPGMRKLSDLLSE